MGIPVLPAATTTGNPASQSALAQALMGTPTAIASPPPQLNFGQGSGMGQGVSQGMNNAFALAKMFGGAQPQPSPGGQPNGNPYQMGTPGANPGAVPGGGTLNPNDPGSQPSINGGMLNPGDNGGQNGTQQANILQRLQSLFAGLGGGGSSLPAMAGTMNAAGAFQ